MDAFRLGEDETLDDYGSSVVIWPYRRSTGDFSVETRLHNLPFNLSLLHFEVESRDGVPILDFVSPYVIDPSFSNYGPVLISHKPSHFTRRISTFGRP